MKESYGEGVANHTGPESCVGAGDCAGEALTGGSAGRVLSREINAPVREHRAVRGADAVELGGRPHRRRRHREARPDPARSETPCMYGNTSRENREVLGPPAAKGVAGRVGKSKDARR